MFPTKILLATDGSEEAGRAARMATVLSEKVGSELHLVRVEPIPSAMADSESVYYGAGTRSRCARSPGGMPARNSTRRRRR